MDDLKIPHHLAIILDGNGRWAQRQNKPRTFGHKKGAENVIEIAKASKKLGIKILTLYAFSTENWKRPQSEVGFLMELLVKFVKDKLEELMAEDCKIRFLGDVEALPKKTRDACLYALEKTKDNESLTINIALNYGARAELVHAFKEIMAKNYQESDITEDLIAENLYTAGMADPDLLIRPGGELRLSNFLIYQMAYTEFYFTEVLWPDFKEDELIKAIKAYSDRDRRYGGL